MLGSFWVGNLFLISLLGLATSFTDLKKGIIPNKFVFPAIAAAFLLNFLNGFDSISFLVNGFLALLLGFLLWLASLWSAGDAKLFLAFALLFPASFFQQSLFPAFSILLNAFIPAFAMLLLLVLLKTSRKQKIEAAKQALCPGTLFQVVVFFFASYWLLDLFLAFLPIQLEIFTITLILFAIVSFVEFFLPKKSVYFFAFLSLLFLFLKFDTVLSPEFLAFFLFFLAMVIFLLFFVLRLGAECFGRLIPLKELKPGHVLLEIPLERHGKIVKKKPLLPSFINIFSEIKEKPFIQLGPKGLTQEDLEKLRQAKGKLAFKELLVQETLPFAPIIFLGTIISFFI
jgi:Flp pilus assembly protein protease CpaA